MQPRHFSRQFPARMIFLAELPLFLGGEIDFPDFLVDEMLLAVLDAAVSSGVVGTDGAKQNADEGQFDDERRRHEQVVQQTIFAWNMEQEERGQVSQIKGFL